jgi:2-polyprenyl-3-methyl-5-hydroxy-6-metoxy-1,4-benzoquinol methylase
MMNSKNAAGFFPSTELAEDDAAIQCVPCPSCPLCGEEGRNLHTALVDWASGVPGNWAMRICAPCGASWLDPQPVEEDIAKLYSSRYYTHVPTRRTRFDGLRDRIRQHVLARMGYAVEPSKEILALVLSHSHSSARAAALDVMNLSAGEVGEILDVGCGNGEFLKRMQSLGWRTSGVDPDPSAVAQGQSQDLRIFCGTIRDLPGSACYDVITLSHVIEHALDPVELLAECGKRLRPTTGRLIVTTPNINSLGHRWFGKYWRGLETPRHLNLFSPKGFSRCVSRAGLRLISLSTETRMARVLYIPSVYGRKGMQRVGERSDFKTSTKVASYFFQLLEDALIRVKQDIGEEIFCVCAAPAKS